MTQTTKVLLSCIILIVISIVIVCGIIFAFIIFQNEENRFAYIDGDSTLLPAPTDITNTAVIIPRITSTPKPTDRPPLPLFPGLDGDTGSPGIGHTDRDRPQLSGPTKTQDSRHFRIHYTLSGTDAVSRLDDNQNDIPDYIEEVTVTMEYIWEVAIDYYGWAAPPPDGDLGGDGRYDVYIQYIFDELSGYTDGGYQETIIGDNPMTDIIEETSSHSFIVLDKAYADVDNEANYTRIEYMRSTAAHEFTHAIQFGYDSLEPAEWLWEATANWMQDQIFDDVNDANEDLDSVFKSPDSCQISEGGIQRLEDANHWYGMWIFIRYIAERHGQEVIRSIWEHAVNLDGYEAVESALNQAGTSLDTIIEGFGVALLTRDFEEGSEYPTVRLDGLISSGHTYQPQDGVAQLGMDFIEIAMEETITISLDSVDLSGLVIGQDGITISIFNMPEGRLAVNPSDFEHMYLMVVNNKLALSENDCYATDYQIAVEYGGESQLPDAIYEVPNFLLPTVEEIIPIQEWIPPHLPHGYVYDQGFMGDFSIFHEDDLLWFMPDSDIGYVIEFSGPNDGYLAVTFSISAYHGLKDWLDYLSYTPQEGELRMINQTEVLLSDWSNAGVYSYAAYLKDGYFVAIDGTITPIEMSRVVESMLTR